MTISEKFQPKHRGRIGPAHSDKREMGIPNWIVIWNSEGLTYEAGQRHVEICFEEVGLTESNRAISHQWRGPPKIQGIVIAQHGGSQSATLEPFSDDKV